MVELVELGVNSVVELEASAMDDLGVEGEPQLVLTQVLHVVLDRDFDHLPCERRNRS